MSFNKMFGAELSYMMEQDEEHFAEGKHLLEKLNISASKELERSYRILR